MKKYLIIITVLLALLLTACTAQPAPEEDVGSSSDSAAAASQSQPTGMTSEQADVYKVILMQLHEKQALQGNWEGTATQQPWQYPYLETVEILDAQRQDDIITVMAEAYGYVNLDLATMTEIDQGTDCWTIQTSGSEEAHLPIGKLAVRIRDTQGILTPISCQYQPYEAPGMTYLKQRTEELAPQLAASPKLDITQYDPTMVDFLWRRLSLRRYIASPAELTQWDLDNVERLDISTYQIFHNQPAPKGFVLDAALLGRLTNLKELTLAVPLKDYSIFTQLGQLDTLILSDLDNYEQITATPDLSTLQCKVRRLNLNDPIGTLDLSGVEAEELSINSWRTTVEGITGGDRIEKLYWMGTRSDTRIINKETFPNAKYLNLYFASTYERVRDFSQLATFGPDVKIELCLTDLALNAKTLESLAGVRLNLLALGELATGTTTTQEAVDALVAQIDAAQVEKGENVAIEFQNRW